MASLPYEILLRFDDAGKYKGGHTIRRDSVTGQLSDAQPVGKDKAFDWPDIAAEINTASLAALATLAAREKALTNEKVAIEAQRIAAESAVAEKEAALADILATLSDEKTDPAVARAKAQLALASKTDRAKAELAALIAQKQAELVALG